MDIRCITADNGAGDNDLGQWDGGGLVVGLFSEGDHPLRRQLATLLGDDLDALLQRRRFRAKPGECLVMERIGANPATVVLVGLGNPDHFDGAALRAAAAKGVKTANRAGAWPWWPGRLWSSGAGCRSPAATAAAWACWARGPLIG